MTIIDGIFSVPFQSEFAVGAVANGTGALTVSTGGLIIGDPSLEIGELGTGFLTIQNNGDILTDRTHLGFNAGATGTATITGAGSSLTAVEVFVGSSGTGTLNINSSGRVDVGSDAWVGLIWPAAPAVTSTAAGSLWAVSGKFMVGNESTGTLNITASSQVAAGSANSRQSLQQHRHGQHRRNRFKVDRFGTVDYWSDGSGTLTVTGGGQVTSAQGEIAFLSPSGSHGAVTVDGSNSKWTNTGALFLGGDGTNAAVGELTISAGGVVQNTGGELDTGSVTVEGPGSQWVNSDSLTIGYKGVGTLTVNGGAVSSGNVVKIGDGSQLASGTMTVTGGGSVSSTDGCIASATNSTGTVSVASGHGR